MKKVKFLILSLTAILAILTNFSGCETIEEQKGETTAVCYIIQNAANGIQITHSDAEKLLHDRPLYEGTSTTIIVADGSPDLLGPVSYQNDGKNAAQRSKKEKAYLEDLALALTATPDSSEIDLITSIQLAGRAVQSSDAKIKRLIFAGPAITTSASFPMAELQKSHSIFDQDPEETASKLASESDEQILKGVEVTWYYWSDTAGSQPKISQHQTEWLSSFWKKYLTVCGASSITFALDPPTGESGSAEYPVSAIEPEETTFQFSKNESVSSGLIILDESSIAFQPDSTIYLDPESASEALDHAVKTMMEHPEITYLVAGSTAAVEGNSLESSQEFGLLRATVVKEDLAARQVQNQLIPIGLGEVDWSGRNAEESLNRAVYLIPCTNDAYQEILKIGKLS